MDAPSWLSYEQAVVIFVAFGLIALGIRRGIGAKLDSGDRRFDPRQMNMRLIWAGLAVWTASAIFGFAAGLVLFDVSRVVFSSITLALTVFILVMAAKFSRLRRREIETAQPTAG